MKDSFMIYLAKKEDKLNRDKQLTMDLMENIKDRRDIDFKYLAAVTTDLAHISSQLGLLKEIKAYAADIKSLDTLNSISYPIKENTDVQQTNQ